MTPVGFADLDTVANRVSYSPAHIKLAFFPHVADMNQVTHKNSHIALYTLAISGLVVWLSFVWQGNKGFNLWDEGFLWYGVQRVLLGEVPIRDFMAYDPGRYYWTAALVSVLGDNDLISLRVAVAAFQALGLFVGLFLVAQSEKNKGRLDIVFLLLSAATLLVWMFPRHKLFDISISILLIGVLTQLINKPTPKRYLIAGVCVGLVAVFGRNHGLYGAIASIGVLTWLSVNNGSGEDLMKAIVFWAAGVVIGYLPIILMAALVPGFANAFWEGVRFQLERGGTNLSLPIPWPWTVNFSAASVGNTIRGVLIGLFFIGTLIFAALSIVWVVFRKFTGKPVPDSLVASAFLAFPYAHYAFSRADVGHLAHGVFPLLVGSLVLLISARPRIKWPIAAALCGASFWVMHVFHPGWQCLSSKQCVDVEVAGKTLQIDPGTANDIALLHQLNDQYAPNGEIFIATPFWPGAYALLERKSPMWAIYALWPRNEAFQKNEIERIKAFNPAFVFILDLPLDGRDDLRFKNTHPAIYKYISRNFDILPTTNNPAYQIYLPKLSPQ